MRSIGTNLILALLSIGIISVTVIFITARWNTRQEFIRFLTEQDRTNIITQLTEYYEINGTWAGAEVYLYPTNGRQGPGDRPPRKLPFILTDPRGSVLIANDRYRVGERVPPSDLKEGVSITEAGELEMSYFKEVLERGNLSIFFNQGGMVERFQKAFAEYTGARVALARVNGMGAMADAVSVRGSGVGTEILCDPVVHFGALAAVYMNAVPRFVDIDPDTYLMDPQSLEANITRNSKAVIATHLWGLPARIDEIRRICNKHKLFLIEDCAHAIGTYWKGRHVGTLGDIGMFSFQEFKQLSTGDGAMLTLKNKRLQLQYRPN